jgi:hypothetical protein
MVAAVGNQGSAVRYPAKYSQVIGVAGVWNDSTHHPLSNTGPEVELAAPFFVTTLRDFDNVPDADAGTSMSSPMVAGVTALTWAARPWWTAANVRSYMQTTAHDLGHPSYSGYGLIDACAAVNCGSGGGGSSLPPPDIVGPDTVEPDVWCSYEANASGGTPPYTFTWYRNGVSLGTGQWMDVYTTTSSFDLRVDVTDSQGAAGSNTMDVTVTASADPCFS